jgi:hypothetical protein
MNRLQPSIRLIKRLGTTQQRAMATLPVDVIVPLTFAVVGAIGFYVRSLRSKPQVRDQAPAISL